MKKVGSKTWKGLLWLCLLPGIAMAQSGQPTPQRHAFSVQQAIDYANKHNVQIKNALIDVQLQQQTNREVTGNAYPTISATGSLVYNAKLPVSLVPAEFFGGQPGTFEKLAFGVKWGATGGVSLNQILFDGQVFTGLQARTTLIDFAEKNREITEELIRTNIYKVYYQLVVSNTQVELLTANIERLEKLNHDAKIMYDNGFAERLDLDKLNVQITNLQTEKTTVLTQIQNGYLGLKVLLGMPVQDSLTLTDELSVDQIKEGVLEATQFTYAQRRDFQYMEMGVKLNEYDVQRYKMSKIPTLSFNAYYNKNAQRNEFNFLKSGGDWFDISALTLQLHIPIFNGFATNARIAKARLSLQQTINQREALKINIDNEVQAAKNNFTTALNNLSFQEKNIKLAEEVYEQTKKKFEAGTGSQTEINTAQTDLKMAQTNYITSLYNAVIARVDFMKATGKL